MLGGEGAKRAKCASVGSVSIGRHGGVRQLFSGRVWGQRPGQPLRIRERYDHRVTGRSLALIGPTASGKTAAAVALARRYDDVELLSVDAMAVYRRLDIGTAKPTRDERIGLNWHLIDLIDPDEEYSVAQFQDAALRARGEIDGREHRALYVGGTGLYHRAVVDGLELAGQYSEVAAELAQRAAQPHGLEELHSELSLLDPVGAARISPSNERRLLRALEVTKGSGQPFSSFGTGMTNYEPTEVLLAGLLISRSELGQRIEQRLNRQLEAGFLDEVAAIRRDFGGLSRTAAQALGYRELIAYLEGKSSLEEARAIIISRTKRFAKRQEAWFRRDPRVIWMDALDVNLVDRLDDLFRSGSK